MAGRLPVLAREKPFDLVFDVQRWAPACDAAGVARLHGRPYLGPELVVGRGLEVRELEQRAAGRRAPRVRGGEHLGDLLVAERVARRTCVRRARLVVEGQPVAADVVVRA